MLIFCSENYAAPSAADTAGKLPIMALALQKISQISVNQRQLSARGRIRGIAGIITSLLYKHSLEASSKKNNSKQRTM